MSPRSPIFRAVVVLAFGALWCAGASAQAGDHAGEAQPRLPADLVVPPAPALSPDEECATFVVPEGFRVELVAAEPLVRDPVAMAWDGPGRLWVVEMRGFMPDADGRGEREPVGSIAVLEDTDGDGRMDARTTFADELVLPRGVLPFRDGALLVLPPDLVFARDTDDDGRADEFEVIESGFRAGLDNPEHAINAPTFGIDNWIRLGNHDARYRLRNGVWERQRTAGAGQWGLTRDDRGRFYFNTNSDPLRGDRIASHYTMRNPNLDLAEGANERIAADRRLWPGRMTTGVNRGYNYASGFLVDWKLVEFTAACGPLIHRGDGFPDGWGGDAYVAEPAANLIKRYRLHADERGRVRGEQAFEGREFLTSTDERFRPVNLYDGPDGALYVVDLYRGVLQHRVFLTTFLREQVDARGLAAPTGLGRIWRVVHEAAPEMPRGDLEGASWRELVALLEHPNGWWRDAAQRRLIARGGRVNEVHDRLHALALHGESVLGRVHALWTLEGIGGLEDATLLAALDDPDREVRLAAMRCAEATLARPGSPLLAPLARVGAGADPDLRWQALLSLGQCATREGADAMRDLLALDCSRAELRSAAVSGLYQRELEFVRGLLADPEWRTEAPGRAALLRLLARAIVSEGRTDPVLGLLGECVEEAAGWRRRALLAGLLEGRPKGPDGKPASVPLARAPAASERIAALEREALGSPEAGPFLAWPGRAGIVTLQVEALTGADLERFGLGREIFAQNCASCHQASGRGEPGKAPPLRYSAWALGEPERLARILLHGMQGPLVRAGREWDLEMPAFAGSDADLAAVLTYVRREWGHGAAPVAPGLIAAQREATAGRVGPWSPAELDVAGD
ncbi:MAG TPA: c-type cytochrome [Planctomycetota bacterium]